MKFVIEPSEAAARLVEALSLRDLLNQVCCPTFKVVGPENREPFGSMFFHPMPKEELKQHIADFKSRCRIPPLIVSDLECGAGFMVLGATRFPNFMSLGQAGSEELAYETGAIAAKEAGELGYNWTFAPVADLARNPDSPVVSIRSAGIHPEHVVKITSAYMRGLQDHGMLATVKHFPGDGFGTYDQHLTTAVNPLNREQWREGPGKVFRDLIDRGAMAVMPGHISLPAFDEVDEATGTYPPATVSRRLLVDLLRGELGFSGLIVTDAVEMGGLVGYMNYFDACALALENGCDILLFPRMDELFYAEMEKRVETGMLSLETLKDRARRVVSLKDQLGLLDGGISAPPLPDPARHAETAREVAARSITVVRDRQGLIPFPVTRQTRVLHVAIMNHHEQYGDLYERLLQELGKYSDHVSHMVDPGPDKLYEVISGGACDLVVCSIGSRHTYGVNAVRLYGEVARNMMGGWTKLGTPVIFVSHYHAYVHKEYETSIDTMVNTYGDIDCTAQYLIEGIFGKRTLNRVLHAHD